ncbi:MAG TPA: hypothetical protein VNM37_08020, partial [Candidatus Dormibacteraeota bacterium]|nr:hypothetical protein [Candidatus Dormibacteraeota bacterium]
MRNMRSNGGRVPLVLVLAVRREDMLPNGPAVAGPASRPGGGLRSLLELGEEFLVGFVLLEGGDEG